MTATRPGIPCPPSPCRPSASANPLKLGPAPLPLLTGARFFAAMSVAICHFHQRGLMPVSDAVPWFFDGGRPAVAFFFVLSGFILTYTYAGRLSSPSACRGYYAARIARIYPNHLLALLAAAVAVGFVLVRHDQARMLEWFAVKPGGQVAFGPSLLAQLLLLTAWVPVAAINQPWNGPTWSVSCEAFFYALLPRLSERLGRLRTPALAAVLATGWAAQGLWILLLRRALPANRSGFLISQFPVTHLFEFTLGVGACVWFLRGGREVLAKNRRSDVLAVCALAAGCGLCALQPVRPAYFLLSPLFAALVLALAVSPRSFRLLAWRPLLLLGEASYALYLFHYPLLLIALVLGVPKAAGPLVLALVVLASAGVYRFWEEPCRRGLRSWMTARREPRRSLVAPAVLDAAA